VSFFDDGATSHEGNGHYTYFEPPVDYDFIALEGKSG